MYLPLDGLVGSFNTLMHFDLDKLHTRIVLSLLPVTTYPSTVCLPRKLYSTFLMVKNVHLPSIR